MNKIRHAASPLSDRLPMTDMCRACEGTGKIKVTVQKECVICEGTGTVLGHPCAKCHGSVPVIEAEETRPCTECLGTALER